MKKWWHLGSEKKCASTNASVLLPVHRQAGILAEETWWQRPTAVPRKGDTTENLCHRATTTNIKTIRSNKVWSKKDHFRVFSYISIQCRLNHSLKISQCSHVHLSLQTLGSQMFTVYALQIWPPNIYFPPRRGICWSSWEHSLRCGGTTTGCRGWMNIGSKNHNELRQLWQPRALRGHDTWLWLYPSTIQHPKNQTAWSGA